MEISMGNELNINENITPWERVKIARGKDRPTSVDYIKKLFDGFIELSGDRIYGDDHAVVGGVALFKGVPVTVIGQQKGKKDIDDAVYRNWGMLSPHGYRKALRLMKQAEKFHRPIICFVDTIGADCRADSEKNGIGTAIAEILMEMSALETPVLSIIISEGGSGGALALAVGNEVWILENAVYSILTPEGYASILWKDSTRASEAADMMKLDSKELLSLGIVEKIIPEPTPVTVENMDDVCRELEEGIVEFLKKYIRKSGKKIAAERYERFRKY